MAVDSTLTRTDFEDFLLRLYFGPEQDGLTACVNRAYLDFSRTLHGFAKLENQKVVHSEAVAELKNSLKKLSSKTAGTINAQVFDAWHKETCFTLIELYRQHQFPLHVGQAQKWVNMSLKYIFTFGANRISGFEPTFQFCHVPIDNIILKRLDTYRFPKLPCAWSRLDSYDVYLDLQIWIRNTFGGCPLDVEFRLWMRPDILLSQDAVAEQDSCLDL